MVQLPMLADIHADNWYLDGLYTPGQAFVEVVTVFHQARTLIENNEATPELLAQLNEQIITHHPENRETDTGFFLYSADKVR